MISLLEFDSTREFLKSKYLEKKVMNPHFSQRVLATKVGFSNGYFSRIVSGEKKLSSELIEKFIKYFNFEEDEAEYFRAMTEYSQCTNQSARSKAFKIMLSLQETETAKIEQDQSELFHTWYHSTLFSLCHMGEITSHTDLTLIGSKLYPPVTADELKDSLTLLESLNLIECSDTIFRVKNQFLTSGKKHKNHHIRNYLLNSIHQAKNALLSTPQSERDISTMTVTVSKNGYNEIQELVKKFKQDVNSVISADSNLDQVCQINIQQFPLYKKGK